MLDFIDNHFGKIVALLTVLTVGLIIVLPTWVTVAYYHGANANQVHEACLIEDKESVNSGDSHTYRVYTSCGNFVVEDEMWAGNFHASDTYRELKEGETYDLTTRGWRVPFSSMFPNIYESKEA